MKYILGWAFYGVLMLIVEKSMVKVITNLKKAFWFNEENQDSLSVECILNAVFYTSIIYITFIYSGLMWQYCGLNISFSKAWFILKNIF